MRHCRANRDLPDKELSRLCELALGEAWTNPECAAPVNEMITNMRRGLRPNASRLLSQSSTAKVILHAFHLARKQLMSCVCHSRAAGQQCGAAWCHLADKPQQHRQGHDSNAVSGPLHAALGCPTHCLTIILPLRAKGCPSNLQLQLLEVMPMADYKVLTA